MSGSLRRTELRAELTDHLSLRAFPRFELARMSKVRFGIVDHDRASFLGLSFSVDILGGSCGGAGLWLGEAESLDLLRSHSMESLEGSLCWVRIAGAGASLVEFVRLA